MKHKDILLWTTALLIATPANSATPDDEDTKQTLTIAGETIDIAGETIERTVSEIRINANNAILLFTDGNTQEVDMKDVSLKLTYNEKTGVNNLRLQTPDGKVRIYNLQGQPVSKGNQSNGIYIVNGKKVTHKK